MENELLFPHYMIDTAKEFGHGLGMWINWQGEAQLVNKGEKEPRVSGYYTEKENNYTVFKREY